MRLRGRWLHAGSVLFAASAVASGLAASAQPDADARLVGVVAQQLPALRVAERGAADGRGSPEAIQAQYNAARTLEEAVAVAQPITRGCLSLRTLLTQLVRADINEAEGVDKPSAGLLALGTRRAAVARATLVQQPITCRGGELLRPPRRVPEMLEPRNGETFTGRIRAAVPAGATTAELQVNGRLWRRFPVKPPLATVAFSSEPGSYRLEIRFFAGTRFLGRAATGGAWLLPPTAPIATPPVIHSRDLDARLAALAGSYRGNVALWVQNLRTGAYGSWNADARFPAASTVKLAVLIAALKRSGPRPERSAIAYDLTTLGRWSSNLAANRLLLELGSTTEAGAQVAQATLHRLGATSSTYTGNYRIGTSRQHLTGDSPDPPPIVSQRVTTARDLARILSLLDRAAMGKADALRLTGLDRHQAQFGLSVLLDSQPTGDNLGLFRPWLSSTYPIAQKNGWLNDARHTAAIFYAPDGPRIIVLLTYKSRETRQEAALLGRQLLQVVFG